MSMRRGITGLLVLSAATALLAGCASGSADAGASSATASAVTGELAGLYEAAKEEGKVVFYGNASPDAMAAIKQGFEQKFPGVEVEAVRLPDAEMIPRLETELSSGAPTADFIENASPGWLLEQGAKGAWAPSDAPEASGNGAYDATSFFDSTNNVYEVGGTVNTFAWNTHLPEHHGDRRSVGLGRDLCVQLDPAQPGRGCQGSRRTG
jgi:iron(III) transport system substrate-binding protein